MSSATTSAPNPILEPTHRPTARPRSRPEAIHILETLPVDMNQLEKMEMEKIRPLTENNWYQWYNWLIIYIPKYKNNF